MASGNSLLRTQARQNEHFEALKILKIFQMAFVTEFSQIKMFEFWLKLNWNSCANNKKSADIQEKTCHQTGKKPLPKQMMID